MNLTRMFSIKQKKDPNVPLINDKSKQMFEKSILSNQNITKRLYKLKNYDELSITEDENEGKPKLNQHSVAIINEKIKNDSDFNDN